MQAKVSQADSHNIRYPLYPIPDGQLDFGGVAAAAAEVTLAVAAEIAAAVAAAAAFVAAVASSAAGELSCVV